MRPRLCLVYQDLASFVRMDAEILAKYFTVEQIQFRGPSDVLRLARRISTAAVSVSWFALGYATAAVAISRVLRKPSVIFLGGWDVAAMPEIGYGAMVGRSRIRKTTWTLRNATVVFAVSETNRQEARRWTNREVITIPLGVDVDYFVPGDGKKPVVATSASVTHEATIRTKGLDILFDAARQIPQVRFKLFGRHSSEMARVLRVLAPSNVDIMGWLERSDVRSTLQDAAVYAQLSAHESFGLTAAEAMACGCTPVVSDRGALPELVGDSGFVVPYGDAAAAASAIAIALETPKGPKARSRILQRFPLALRQERLLRAIEGLL